MVLNRDEKCLLVGGVHEGLGMDGGSAIVQDGCMCQGPKCRCSGISLEEKE